MGDILVVLGAFAALFAIVALLWIFRKRLHSNVSFTAETVFHDFQMDEKRAAIRQIDYVKQDVIQEETGEPAGDEPSPVDRPM